MTGTRNPSPRCEICGSAATVVVTDLHEAGAGESGWLGRCWRRVVHQFCRGHHRRARTFFRLGTPREVVSDAIRWQVADCGTTVEEFYIGDTQHAL